MFRILVPIDFENSTDNACRYALRLASGMPQAEILLLHCFRDYLTDPWELPADEGIGVEPTPSEQIAERVLHRNETEEQERLEELRQELQSTREGQQLQLKTAFIYGMPEDVIPEEAQRFKPDLLVMGTEGEDSLSRSLFGTVTTKMAEEVQVPVLSVPVGSNVQTVARVLYATDFDETDAQAIADLQQLLAPLQPQILCLHIASGTAAPQDHEQLNQLQTKVETLTSGTNIRYLVLEGDDVAEALENFSRKEQVDLLAVTNRKRSFFHNLLHTSLTKKLVLEAELPLLIFHSHGS